MNLLSPSILSADLWKLGEDIKAVEGAGVPWLHVDVMDGLFVPSISYGMPVLKAVRSHTDMFLDVHLMIEEPGRYIDDLAEVGADLITVHAEACKHLDRTIEAIKEKGLLAGVALNPATPLSAIEWVLPKVDMVLIMSVNPGFGGQAYIPYCANKVRQIREMAKERNLTLDIEVDGGINKNTIQEVVDAGANIIVAGSAVFQGDVDANVKELKGIMER